MSLNEVQYRKIVSCLLTEGDLSPICKLLLFIPEEIKRKELRALFKEAIDKGDLELAQAVAKESGRELTTDDLLDLIASIQEWGFESCKYEVDVANLLPEPKRTEVIAQILIRESEILGSEIKARHEASLLIGRPSEPQDYLPEVEERIETGMVDLAIEFIQLFGKDQMPPETLLKVRKMLEEEGSYPWVKEFLNACGEEPSQEIRESILKRYLQKDSFRRIGDICEMLDYRPLKRDEALKLLESTKTITRPNFEKDEIEAIINILKKTE
jgi:hypothetical protein